MALDPSEAAREAADYAERIRRTNERLALAIGLFILSGLLPITAEKDRLGILLSGGTLLVLSLIHPAAIYLDACETGVDIGDCEEDHRSVL